MKIRQVLFCSAVAVLLLLGKPAYSQSIGSYDNFDCFNNTGETAEGFEIDVEDVHDYDLSREFPSNFSATPWVIRYGLPTVTNYDWTVNPPDSAHSYDAGHVGVLITWAATWDGTQWVAQYGNQSFGTTIAGNGTPYVKKPTYTLGDSCWYYGLGNAYPTSGCDHFGISFNSGVTPGQMFYHWQVPDPNNTGMLRNSSLVASIPPSPSLAPAVWQVGVVHAAAEAPENPEPQWSDAYWVKVTTFYAAADAVLDDLQKANVKQTKTKKVVNWNMLQRPPAGDAVDAEKEDAADDAIPAGDVQVTKQYEYYAYKGAYDSGTHEALCGIVAVGNSGDCTAPYTKTYTVQDPETGNWITVKGGDKGTYLGAHINAYNMQ